MKGSPLERIARAVERIAKAQERQAKAAESVAELLNRAAFTPSDSLGRRDNIRGFRVLDIGRD